MSDVGVQREGARDNWETGYPDLVEARREYLAHQVKKEKAAAAQAVVGILLGAVTALAAVFALTMGKAPPAKAIYLPPPK